MCRSYKSPDIKKGMGIHMAKHIRLDLVNEEELCNLGKAISTPVRLKILSLVNFKKMSIAEIARELNIPASSAALNVKVLQEADLIRIEEQPGTRGSIKLCTRNIDKIDIRLVKPVSDIHNVMNVEMPIGAYTKCQVMQTCGLAKATGIIGMDDMEQAFYLPERFEAQILWTARGFVEYVFPNKLKNLPYKCEPQSLILSAELCSEVPGFREDWKSDITLWVNDVECGTWTSPGDFGARRGRNNPISWAAGRTQYGMLTTWEIKTDGCYINREKVSKVKIEDLQLMKQAGITVRIGNKEDARYRGGFNLFGKQFGDYDQDILLSLVYKDLV